MYIYKMFDKISIFKAFYLCQVKNIFLTKAWIYTSQIIFTKAWISTSETRIIFDTKKKKVFSMSWKIVPVCIFFLSEFRIYCLLKCLRNSSKARRPCGHVYQKMIRVTLTSFDTNLIKSSLRYFRHVIKYFLLSFWHCHTKNGCPFWVFLSTTVNFYMAGHYVIDRITPN